MKSRIEENIFTCPQCGFSANKENDTKDADPVTSSDLPYLDRTLGSSLKIMDTELSPDALPTISIDCQKCGNSNAYWWMLQTRSADEATTQFYRCTKCGHTWRNYS